ncbi:glutamate racemase [Sphingomonas sp. 2378]|uniref:glutamate racemase n=1 Tax=Sphingomonas sp. 2378 TaxID=1219748 RepID=UPI00311ADBF2
MTNLTAPVHSELPRLVQPIAVFDAGIGSYAAVAAIRYRLPDQDILYFADRASFPYGNKGRAELLAILGRTLSYLDTFEPSAVLVASNAPSITVLDDLIGEIDRPIFGVRPPIAEALHDSGGGDVAVLGVASMVRSPELRAYADAQAGNDAGRVHLVDASSLVDLVESGAFLFDRERTQKEVNAFFGALARSRPGITALTLSSTHLPWLRSYMERARPDWRLFDPLEAAIDAILPHATQGNGTILGLVTEDDRFGVEDFQSMLTRLGVSLPLYRVAP